MFFNKRKEQRKNEMLDALNAILPAKAKLISFEYHEKIFGNMIVEIEVDNIKHTFITDRGEICHNGKMLCDSSYNDIEKVDTFHKLLQMIKIELGV